MMDIRKDSRIKVTIQNQDVFRNVCIWAENNSRKSLSPSQVCNMAIEYVHSHNNYKSKPTTNDKNMVKGFNKTERLDNNLPTELKQQLRDIDRMERIKIGKRGKNNYISIIKNLVNMYIDTHPDMKEVIEHRQYIKDMTVLKEHLSKKRY